MAGRRVRLVGIAGGGVARDGAGVAATGEVGRRRNMVGDGREAEVWALAGAIRRRLGMTQAQFAAAIGVPVATLRNWEQGRVAPDPAARALLRILDREPEAALRALGRGGQGREW